MSESIQEKARELYDATCESIAENVTIVDGLADFMEWTDGEVSRLVDDDISDEDLEELFNTVRGIYEAEGHTLVLFRLRKDADGRTILPAMGTEWTINTAIHRLDSLAGLAGEAGAMLAQSLREFRETYID